MSARSTTVLPDFASSDYAEARLQLRNKGVAEDLVIPTLDILWTLTNAQECQHRNESLDPDPKSAREYDLPSAGATELCRRTLSQEQELTKREQRKESRNKVVPTPGVSVPPSPFFRTSSAFFCSSTCLLASSRFFVALRFWRSRNLWLAVSVSSESHSTNMASVHDSKLVE
ncbi:hypothetical protein PAXINDRAFT_156299 [Paxillus involutus ATCC 200175]|uniref:Uncharacterized protein n=1 Tax=Paxillus involutus ATCC 200175 TaxID=664439 RepID=A0A0C9TUF8_PAXIN|nr:hypothetical protein PAXINDRAFT_156299 [Paxillus involutus ATCC 200175]